jgi:hypothetical protein
MGTPLGRLFLYYISLTKYLFALIIAKRGTANAISFYLSSALALLTSPSTKVGYLSGWTGWLPPSTADVWWIHYLPWLLWCFFILGLLLKENHRRVATIEDEIKSVNELMKPKLTALFVTNMEPYRFDIQGKYLLHRIGIKNISAVPVTHIRVQLLNLGSQPTAELPQHLRQMNDHVFPAKEEFDLAPGDDKYIDVLEQRFGNYEPGYSRLSTITSPVVHNLDIGKEYRLQISITGFETQRIDTYIDVKPTTKEEMAFILC